MESLWVRQPCRVILAREGENGAVPGRWCRPKEGNLQTQCRIRRMDSGRERMTVGKGDRSVSHTVLKEYDHTPLSRKRSLHINTFRQMQFTCKPKFKVCGTGAESQKEIKTTCSRGT